MTIGAHNKTLGACSGLKRDGDSTKPYWILILPLEQDMCLNRFFCQVLSLGLPPWGLILRDLILGLWFSSSFSFLIYLFLEDFIYLFDREREHKQGEREKQAPWEPDVGLDPRTLGSCPELKAGT